MRVTKGNNVVHYKDVDAGKLVEGYTYDKKENTLLTPPKESERKYPPKEFRDTFEQEMKERLKSC